MEGTHCSCSCGCSHHSSSHEHAKTNVMHLVSSAALFLGLGLEYFMELVYYANLLFYVSVIFGIYNLAKTAVSNLRKFEFNMSVLMVFAIISALAINKAEEAAAVIVLYNIGQWLENKAVYFTRSSLDSLLKLSPKEACIEIDGLEKQIPVETIIPGDIVLVRPGEIIPVDGVVINGNSEVNQANITGEALPVYKKEQDEVYAGTINQTGALKIKALKRNNETVLSKIMYLIEEAGHNKAPLQQVVECFAKYYTPAVIFGAVLIAIIPPVFLRQDFSKWLYNALVLLVISCPCALVISTPVALVSAIGSASRHGILIKGGAFLEALADVNVVAFDKTGTITEGDLRVKEITALKNFTQEDVLIIAASVENYSEHLIAKAIVREIAPEKLYPVTDYRSIPGKGASAKVDGKAVYVGNLTYISELGYDITEIEKAVQTLEQQNLNIVIVAYGNEVIGLIAIDDLMRDSIDITIKELYSLGVEHIIMLTGDNQCVAENIAQKAGIKDYRAALLPQDKVKIITELKNRYRTVIMVGDGFNDAPALANSTIGIAMGNRGVDAAIEASDITFMTGDLGKLHYLIKKARQTVNIIKQNIVFAVGLKSIFAIFAVLGLANLWMAVVADTGAALIVILNSLRLSKEKLFSAHI